MFNVVKKHNTWVKLYIKGRQSFGAYNTLLSDLAADDITICVQYIRMDIAIFVEIYAQVELSKP